MSDKLNHIDVPLEFSIPDTEEDKPALTALRITRPKTRHIITLTALFGPDLASFIASSDGDDAKAKLAALQDDAEGLGVLIANLVKAETLNALLKVIADLCGITFKQAEEIDIVDLVEVGKAFIGFFPALKLPVSTEPLDEPQT